MFLINGTTATKERFTGKELDNDGDIGSGLGWVALDISIDLGSLNPKNQPTLILSSEGAEGFQEAMTLTLDVPENPTKYIATMKKVVLIKAGYINKVRVINNNRLNYEVLLTQENGSVSSGNMRTFTLNTNLATIYNSTSPTIATTFEGVEGGQEMGLMYFGRRYYDAEIGVWTSVDEVHQFYNPYAYASHGKNGGTNPVVFVDYNGAWGPLFHWATGNWDVMMVDNYRNQSGSKGKRGHDFSHGWVKDENRLKELLSTSKEEILASEGLSTDLFTDDEWEAIRMHAFEDYYHHQNPTATSPIEAMLSSNGTLWEKPSPRTIYQDIKDASIPAMIASPLVTPLLDPGTASLYITVSATMFVDWMWSYFYYNSFIYPKWMQMRYEFNAIIGPASPRVLSRSGAYTIKRTDRSSGETHEYNADGTQQ